MNGLIFLVILGLGYIMYLSYGKKLLAEGRKGKIKIAVIVIGLVILLAVATGRANVLMAPLGAAMALITRFGRFAPMLLRYFPQLRNVFGDIAQPMAGNPGTGSSSRGRSRVQTNTLVMLFDHASGNMDGTVKRGQFEGYQLSDLSVAELRNLYQYCSGADPEAMRLLNVYLARYHSQHFGSAGMGDGEAGSTSPDVPGTMDDKEAYEILGLEPGANREEITRAHRTLIGKMHPDKGGSTYLATKINAARDQLLK